MHAPHPDTLLPAESPESGVWYTRMTPLKTNAFSVLRPEYAALGLAATPIKTLQESISIRIVWVYPKYRNSTPIEHYVLFGTASFPIPQTLNDLLPKGRLRPALMSEVYPHIIPHIPENHLTDPICLFSESGHSEIATAITASFKGGHPRTLAYLDRLKRIKELKVLWVTPLKIAEILRTEGRFSKKTPITQQAYQIRVAIDKLKAEEPEQTLEIKTEDQAHLQAVSLPGINWDEVLAALENEKKRFYNDHLENVFPHLPYNQFSKFAQRISFESNERGDQFVKLWLKKSRWPTCDPIDKYFLHERIAYATQIARAFLTPHFDTGTKMIGRSLCGDISVVLEWLLIDIWNTCGSTHWHSNWMDLWLHLDARAKKKFFFNETIEDVAKN